MAPHGHRAIPTTIGPQHGATHITQSCTAQTYQRPGLLLGRRVPPDRPDRLVDDLLACEVLEGRHHRRFCGAGVDAVDPDALPREFGIPPADPRIDDVLGVRVPAP